MAFKEYEVEVELDLDDLVALSIHRLCEQNKTQLLKDNGIRYKYLEKGVFYILFDVLKEDTNETNKDLH
jgi:hypothetical protein